MGNHFREQNTIVQNKPANRRHILKSMAGLAAVGTTGIAATVEPAKATSDYSDIREGIEELIIFFQECPDNCLEYIRGADDKRSEALMRADRSVWAQHLQSILYFHDRKKS